METELKRTLPLAERADIGDSHTSATAPVSPGKTHAGGNEPRWARGAQNALT